MSNLNELKRLENDLRESVDLQKKLDEAVKRIAEEGKTQSDGEIMAAAAKELGYDISITALEQAKAEAQRLDPEELNAVAGGQSEHDAHCLTAWHCYTVTLHTEVEDEYTKCGLPFRRSSHNESCWSDFNCAIVNH